MNISLIVAVVELKWSYFYGEVGLIELEIHWVWQLANHFISPDTFIRARYWLVL